MQVFAVRVRASVTMEVTVKAPSREVACQKITWYALFQCSDELHEDGKLETAMNEKVRLDVIKAGESPNSIEGVWVAID